MVNCCYIDNMSAVWHCVSFTVDQCRQNECQPETSTWVQVSYQYWEDCYCSCGVVCCCRQVCSTWLALPVYWRVGAALSRWKASRQISWRKWGFSPGLVQGAADEGVPAYNTVHFLWWWVTVASTVQFKIAVMNCYFVTADLLVLSRLFVYHCLPTALGHIDHGLRLLGLHHSPLSLRCCHCCWCTCWLVKRDGVLISVWLILACVSLAHPRVVTWLAAASKVPRLKSLGSSAP